MAELVRRGIVRAPLAGTAVAVKPIYQSRAVPGTHAVTAHVKNLIDTYVRDVVDPEVSPDDAAAVGDKTPELPDGV